MSVSGNSKSLNYRYTVKGHTYTGTWGQMPRSWGDYWRGDFVAKNFVYEQFIVRCNCQQSDVSKIDWSHSIPANIGAAPYEGWVNLPTEFPKTQFAN